MTKITVTIDANESSESAKYEHLITDAFRSIGFGFGGFGRLRKFGAEVLFVHGKPAAVAPAAVR